MFISLFVSLQFYILGVDRFLELVKDAEEEYEKDYRIEYERLREAKKEAEKVWILYTKQWRTVKSIISIMQNHNPKIYKSLLL